jgi:predicted nucleotidyltransferase
MSTTRRSATKTLKTRWYRGVDIPLSVIRRYAHEVAERFHPDKIILFGSHAYGTPHADSDVDLLVIMPCRNELDQSFKIRCQVESRFPMDLIVMKPQHVKWRLEERESFVTEIITRGKTRYEKNDARVGGQGGGGLLRRRTTRRRKKATP